MAVLTGPAVFSPEFFQSQQGWRSQQQTSSQRISCHGLEMKSELVWERWEPRREFTKTLVLKNVHSKLQKLNVRSYKNPCAHTEKLAVSIKFSPFILQYNYNIYPPSW